ncbi:hypothetical protein ANN_16375, partial [Periplaneta americana]
MNPGSSTESYPAFARIGLRENPGKNLNQVTCPDRDSNPGHLVSRPDALTVTPQLFSTYCVNVKMQYTLDQRLFLVTQYWITNSITATQRAYQREFGVRKPPKRNTILGLVNKLETTGSLAVVITEDVQNVHLLLEYRPHIDVSLTCEHDPKLQEYCVCPQNMPQFDSEGIPNQAPETNKPMILNGPTSRNREGSDQ